MVSWLYHSEPMASTSWQKHEVKQNYLPHGQGAIEKGGKAGVPLSPSKAHPLCDLKTSHQAPLLKGSTTSQAFSTWALGGHSRSDYSTDPHCEADLHGLDLHSTLLPVAYPYMCHQQFCLSETGISLFQVLKLSTGSSLFYSLEATNMLHPTLHASFRLVSSMKIGT